MALLSDVPVRFRTVTSASRLSQDILLDRSQNQAEREIVATNRLRFAFHTVRFNSQDPSGSWHTVDGGENGGHMHCWLFFHRQLAPDIPEAPEVYRFLKVARRMGIELDVLRPQEFDLVVDSAEGWSALYKGRKLKKPDVIIPRTGSETSYFTLAVMRHFERQGVAMINGPAAIETVTDKLRTLQILSKARLPIPKTILCKFPVDVNLVERELGFPVVVKTVKGTRGAGVLLCSDRAQFHDLANLLDEAGPGADFIFQQYIATSHGRDVRILVINGKAIAAMERRSVDGGFKSNLSLGGHGAPFVMPDILVRLAVRVAEALNLDVAGVDILFDLTAIASARQIQRQGFKGWRRLVASAYPRRFSRSCRRSAIFRSLRATRLG